MKELAGKVAVISGGASGIGLGMAQAMAAQGISLALVDIDTDALDAATLTLRAQGTRVLPLQMDVREPVAWRQAADEIEARLGPVSILCSNAGVAGSRLSVEETEVDAWQWTFDINLNGAFHAIKTFVPRMLMQGNEAHIVVTSSLGGFLPHGGNAAYCASKAAVIALCESLRDELADTPVGISALCPGLVSTRLLTNNRRLAPSSIGHLCNDEPELQAQMTTALDPLCVGELVLDGIRERRFWLFTHPELRDLVRARSEEIQAAMS